MKKHVLALLILASVTLSLPDDTQFFSIDSELPPKSVYLQAIGSTSPIQIIKDVKEYSSKRTYDFETSAKSKKTLKVEEITGVVDGIDDFTFISAKKEGNTFSFNLIPDRSDSVFSNNMAKFADNEWKEDSINCVYEVRKFSSKTILTDRNEWYRNLVGFYHVVYFLNEKNEINRLFSNEEFKQDDQFTVEDEHSFEKMIKVGENIKNSQLALISSTHIYFYNILNNPGIVNPVTQVFSSKIGKADIGLENKEVYHIDFWENKYIFATANSFVIAARPEEGAWQVQTIVDTFPDTKENEIIDIASYDRYLYVIVKDAGLFVYDINDKLFFPWTFEHPNLEQLVINKNGSTDEVVLNILVKQAANIREYFLVFFLRDGQPYFNKAYMSKEDMNIVGFSGSMSYNVLVSSSGKIQVMRNGVYHHLSEQIYRTEIDQNSKIDIVENPFLIVDTNSFKLALIVLESGFLTKVQDFSYDGEYLECEFPESGQYELVMRYFDDNCSITKETIRSYCSIDYTMRFEVSEPINFTVPIIVAIVVFMILATLIMIIACICRRKKKEFDTNEPKKIPQESDRRQHSVPESIEIVVKDNI